MCNIKTDEEYSFLMGYYSHLIADAEFQRFIRDENRVASAWKRIKSHSVLMEKSSGMPQNWDSVKILIDNNDRMKDIYSIEADYLPKGAIVRKINVMGYIPKKEISTYPYIGISKEEYKYFVNRQLN